VIKIIAASRGVFATAWLSEDVCRFMCVFFADTSAELECARETICRQETALIDKERDFCQKLEQARAEDFCKIRQLRSEMYSSYILLAYTRLLKTSACILSEFL